MKNKLYIKFDSDSEINNIPADLIFNNIKDAEDYFNENMLTTIYISPENNCFSFKFNNTWSGRGECRWIKLFE